MNQNDANIDIGRIGILACSEGTDRNVRPTGIRRGGFETLPPCANESPVGEGPCALPCNVNDANIDKQGATAINDATAGIDDCFATCFDCFAGIVDCSPARFDETPAAVDLTASCFDLTTMGFDATASQNDSTPASFDGSASCFDSTATWPDSSAVIDDLIFDGRGVIFNRGGENVKG